MSFSEWYSRAMDEAIARFRPLTEALARHGVTAEVWQTGGMVMCLGVPLVENPDGPYALFSEFDEFGCATLGIYLHPEDGTEGVMHENPDIPDDAAHAEEIAAWAAPIIKDAAKNLAHPIL